MSQLESCHSQNGMEVVKSKKTPTVGVCIFDTFYINYKPLASANFSCPRLDPCVPSDPCRFCSSGGNTTLVSMALLGGSWPALGLLAAGLKQAVDLSEF